MFMPGLWMLPIAVLPGQTGGTDQVEGGLVVQWQHKQVQLRPRKLIFSGGVVARYGVTEVRCDTLTLELEGERREGTAQGSVQVIDPDGTLNAKEATFDWKEGKGKVVDALGMAHRFELKAAKIEFDPKRWSLDDVTLTSRYEPTPLFALHSTRLEATPFGRGTAYKASLYFFGQRLVTLPRYRFSLNKNERTWRLPSVSLGRQGGLGASWGSDFAVGGRGNLALGLQTFPGTAFGGAVDLQATVSGRDLVHLLTTFGDRDALNYFGNIYVDSPESEWEARGRRRTTVGLSSSLSQTVPGRRTTAVYTAPIEGAVEVGGDWEGLAWSGQVRAQQIREESGPSSNRGIVGFSLGPKPSRGVSLHARLDAQGYWQPGEDYAWVKGELGVVVPVSARSRFGVAYAATAHSGVPMLQIDPPYADRSLMARFDLGDGPTKISFLAKYDLESKRWYDHEVALRQLAGCVEPFFVWRRFPSSLNIGIRLRVDELFDALRKREKS